jgi:hypothetical protein
MGRKQNQPIEIFLESPAPLSRVLSDNQISVEKIQLMMRNHRPVLLDETIQPGDRLALFPKEYPFFVDWYDYRNKSKPDGSGNL